MRAFRQRFSSPKSNIAVFEDADNEGDQWSLTSTYKLNDSNPYMDRHSCPVAPSCANQSASSLVVRRGSPTEPNAKETVHGEALRNMDLKIEHNTGSDVDLVKRMELRPTSVETHEHISMILRAVDDQLRKPMKASDFATSVFTKEEDLVLLQARLQSLLPMDYASVSPNDISEDSIAFEHTELNTIPDIFAHVPNVEYDQLEEVLKGFHSDNFVEPLPARLRRMIAKCTWRRGDHVAAFDKLSIRKEPSRQQSDPEQWNVLATALEKIMMAFEVYGSSTTQDGVTIVLRHLAILSASDHAHELFDAVRRRLADLKVGHFTHKAIEKALAVGGSPISEVGSQVLGRGAYATVESVKIGTQCYARKAITLPRHRQGRIRDAIQNEISVINALNHPHIIRVFLTYEDKTRFFIVMEPLAKCDLEAYMARHVGKPLSSRHKVMIRRWFICLANSLAFIHSKGVRHKDIKSLNILVHGDNVIFADFGSSHIFLEGDHSTSEGPSHGHTKMYCAPEVITYGKRNRSADVFSLGCVFVELAIWLYGPENFSIADWHTFREAIAYSASLDKVAEWFENQEHRTPRERYRDLIGKMLAVDPKARPTAREASEIALALFNPDLVKKKSEPCPECRLDLWVDDQDQSLSGRSVVLEPSTTASQGDNTLLVPESYLSDIWKEYQTWE
ncbi:kinase-like protein [Setomelanomma holmii]|uniref:non-specific serine/threonine protein kinase n=1 Tax=Setomelanomma holmii TaxID=210430 RepID=A0A9P4LNN4_9PLEO|nr:kinase-like protein [Setomelanomma holmii]